LQSLFLGKNVTIEAAGYLIKGKLLDYRDSERGSHLPNVLIIQNKEGSHVLRIWNVIKA